MLSPAWIASPAIEATASKSSTKARAAREPSLRFYHSQALREKTDAVLTALHPVQHRFFRRDAGDVYSLHSVPDPAAQIFYRHGAVVDLCYFTSGSTSSQSFVIFKPN